nr:protein trichome birefringence-like 4 [Ipomoea trifida]
MAIPAREQSPAFVSYFLLPDVSFDSDKQKCFVNVQFLEQKFCGFNYHVEDCGLSAHGRVAFLHDVCKFYPRNMWELLICSLRESLVNKSKLFEVSGHYEFKTRWYHSFMFKIEACDSKAGSKMISRGLSASLFLEDLRQNWFKAKDLRQSSQ